MPERGHPEVFQVLVRQVRQNAGNQRRSQRKRCAYCPSLALLWQIYSRCFSVPIQVRQYGHRRGLDRMMRSTMACRMAGSVG